jgi:hypothetical protein
VNGISIVKLSDDDGCESNYLIYELSGLTESVSSKANNNLIIKAFNEALLRGRRVQIMSIHTLSIEEH